jgi:hypothetical protein
MASGGVDGRDTGVHRLLPDRVQFTQSQVFAFNQSRSCALDYAFRDHTTVGSQSFLSDGNIGFDRTLAAHGLTRPRDARRFERISIVETITGDRDGPRSLKPAHQPADFPLPSTPPEDSAQPPIK